VNEVHRLAVCHRHYCCFSIHPWTFKKSCRITASLPHLTLKYKHTVLPALKKSSSPLDRNLSSKQLAERASVAMAPYLPSEILQTIFRGDLLRCKQVNKEWAFVISGSDAVLNHKLFASSARIVKSKPSKMPVLTLRPIFHMFLMQHEGELPCLGYDIALHWDNQYRKLPKQRSEHPIIENFSQYMSFVNEHFDHTDAWDKREQVLFRDIETLTDYLNDDPEDYGSWMDQLMCIPAVDQLDIRLLWHKTPLADSSDVERVLRTSKMKNGVTVGEVVRTVRKMMKHAATDIKKFTHELEINICDRCGQYCDDWGNEWPGSDSDEEDPDNNYDYYDDDDETDKENYYDYPDDGGDGH
jgi:hypothetical protein